MRTFTDIVAPAEDLGFGIVSMDDLTDHYRRTIDEWIANVKQEAGRIDAIEPGLSERLVHYMEVANAGWGYTCKYYAITFDKRGDPEQLAGPRQGGPVSPYTAGRPGNNENYIGR